MLRVGFALLVVISLAACSETATPVPAWTTYPTAGELRDNPVTDMAVALDGAVWFATYGGGAFRFDPSAAGKTGGQAWTAYTQADGLASDKVTAIAFEPGGAVWFGTDGGGASRFDPSTASGADGTAWTTYTQADGLAGNGVTSIALEPAPQGSTGGAVWFGTLLDGASRFDLSTALPGLPARTDGTGGKAWITFDPAHGDSDGVVYPTIVSVAPAQDGAGGKVWFGTYHGLSSLDLSAALPSPPAGTGTTDSEAWGKYWPGDGWVRNIAFAPDGAVWIITAGYGDTLDLFKLMPDKRQLTPYTKADGLASDLITAIAIGSDGRLWFGTDAGASCLDGETWTTYTTADGLAGNAVYDIAVAPDGAMWFGTDGSLTRYLPSR